MTGPGADYTPFSKLLNLVIVANPAEGVSSYEHEETIRIAGLKAADYIAKSVQDLLPDDIKTYETKPIFDDLYRNTRIFQKLHMYMPLQSQGAPSRYLCLRS